MAVTPGGNTSTIGRTAGGRTGGIFTKTSGASGATGKGTKEIGGVGIGGATGGTGRKNAKYNNQLKSKIAPTKEDINKIRLS